MLQNCYPAGWNPLYFPLEYTLQIIPVNQSRTVLVWARIPMANWIKFMILPLIYDSSSISNHSPSNISNHTVLLFVWTPKLATGHYIIPAKHVQASLVVTSTLTVWDLKKFRLTMSIWINLNHGTHDNHGTQMNLNEPVPCFHKPDINKKCMKRMNTIFDTLPHLPGIASLLEEKGLIRLDQ